MLSLIKLHTLIVNSSDCPFTPLWNMMFKTLEVSQLPSSLMNHVTTPQIDRDSDCTVLLPHILSLHYLLHSLQKPHCSVDGRGESCGVRRVVMRTLSQTRWFHCKSAACASAHLPAALTFNDEPTWCAMAVQLKGRRGTGSFSAVEERQKRSIDRDE